MREVGDEEPCPKCGKPAHWMASKESDALPSGLLVLWCRPCLKMWYATELENPFVKEVDL